MILKTENNQLTAYGTIWGGDGLSFVEVFSKLEKRYDIVIVRMHTEGGSVFDGNLIYNALNQSQSKVKLKIDGLAASMGAIIMTAVEDVEIVDNGYVMIHAPSSGSWGTAKDKESEAKLLRAIEAKFKEQLKNKTNQPEEVIQTWLEGNNWFTAQEAVEIGLADAVIPARKKVVLNEHPSKSGLKAVAMAYSELLIDKKRNKTTKQNKQNKQNKPMKSKLITLFMLEAVTAESSDTAVAEALMDKFKAEEARAEEAEEALKEHKDNQINTLVNNGVKSGLIDNEQKETYEKVGQLSGVEHLKVVLDSLRIKRGNPASISTDINSSTKTSRESWDFDKWQEEDPQGLEKMADKETEKFNKLFKEKYNK